MDDETSPENPALAWKDQPSRLAHQATANRRQTARLAEGDTGEGEPKDSLLAVSLEHDRQSKNQTLLLKRSSLLMTTQFLAANLQNTNDHRKMCVNFPADRAILANLSNSYPNDDKWKQHQTQQNNLINICARLAKFGF